MDDSVATRNENVNIIKDYLKGEFKDFEVEFL